MKDYFAGVKDIETLRKRYKELLRTYHPDNPNGSTEATQQINEQHDRLFAILSKGNKSDTQTTPMRKMNDLKPF